MKGLPESVKSVEIDEDDEKAAPYVFVDSVDGLLALVQMGTIEFHPWGSTVDRLELPDVLVFDLDPAPELGWRVVVESAFHVRDGLRSVGFDPLTKVTGGKGIHIIVPVEPTVEWSEAKRFCEHFAKTLATTNPKRYVAKVSKTARTGKILIDYLRNGRGATAVAPYSLRARPNLPVALPVKWEDLPSLEPAAFPLSSSGDAIERYLDAWSDYEDHRRPWPKF